MPRGGARPGSGPPPNPHSARSKAKAARAAKLGLVPNSPPAPLSPTQVEAGPADAGRAAIGLEKEKPLELMYRLMESRDPRIALQAAIAAAPYVHPKLMPVKVKDDKEKKPNRFSSPLPPPRLVSNKT